MLTIYKFCHISYWRFGNWILGKNCFIHWEIWNKCFKLHKTRLTTISHWNTASHSTTEVKQHQASLSWNLVWVQAPMTGTGGKYSTMCDPPSKTKCILLCISELCWQSKSLQKNPILVRWSLLANFVDFYHNWKILLKRKEKKYESNKNKINSSSSRREGNNNQFNVLVLLSTSCCMWLVHRAKLKS